MQDGEYGAARIEGIAHDGEPIEIWIVAAKFPIGQLVATPGALEAIANARQTPDEFLARHVMADWGDLDEEDRKSNDEALTGGGRLLSAYTLSDDARLWIITEWDRSATTLLLPSEY